MTWLLKFLGGAKVYLIVGVSLAAVGLGAYWMIGKNAQLRMESRQKSEAIKAYAGAFQRESDKLRALNIRFQLARDNETNAETLTHNVNIGEMIENDPDRAADAINNLFDSLFAATEQASRGSTYKAANTR